MIPRKPFTVFYLDGKREVLYGEVSVNYTNRIIKSMDWDTHILTTIPFEVVRKFTRVN